VSFTSTFGFDSATWSIADDVADQSGLHRQAVEPQLTPEQRAGWDRALQQAMEDVVARVREGEAGSDFVRVDVVLRSDGTFDTSVLAA
jgi:hypothetical protein